MKSRAWTGDLAGGLTAMMVALPVELVYGLFAVAPLGPAFANHGLRAALWACIMGGVLGFLLRTTGGLITGSRPACALILGTLAAALLQHVTIQNSPDPEGMVFVLILLCAALAGIFQLLFGLLNLGRALKYVPYPVIAGLMCGVGALMLLSAFRPGLGVTYDTPWDKIFESWHPLSFLVATLTLVLCFTVPKWTRRIPGMVVALFAGVLLHHLLFAVAGADQLGPTAGEIDGLLPSYTVWVVVLGHQGGELLNWLQILLPYALAIAAFSSLETLLCLSTVESVKHQRIDGDRELRKQGIINFLAGLSGATSITGNLSRVMVNLSSGGHSPFSALVYASSLILVALVAVLGDMMKAVGVGTAAAMFLFLRSSMKPVIRRVFNAQYCRSLKVRSHQHMHLLEKEGGKISIIEVEGALFFGTSDRVSREIETVASRAASIILDLKRVSDVDPTGARTLLQAARKMHAQNKSLLLSGANPRVERLLRALGLDLEIVLSHWHHDLDSALEMLEDELLGEAGGGEQNFVSLEKTDIAEGLTVSQIGILEFFLTRHQFDAPGLVFNSGDGGESLFIAGESAVDILLPLKNGQHKRVASFAPGVVFGEMALLERKPRSADAMLLAPSVVWELSRKNLDRIEVQHPEIAHRILLNLGCCLAARLRLTTTELRLAVET